MIEKDKKVGSNSRRKCIIVAAAAAAEVKAEAENSLGMHQVSMALLSSREMRTSRLKAVKEEAEKEEAPPQHGEKLFFFFFFLYCLAPF